VLNAKIRTAWDKTMRPVGTVVGRSGITPNGVTLLGLGVQVVVAYLIVTDRLVAAGFVMVVAALLDTVDGAVAKAQGAASPYGALLDSTTDRLSDALVFLPVAWLYLAGARADQDWVGVVALVAFVASFLVSYIKARAEGLGVECNVGLIERAERLILMMFALAFNAILPAILLLLTVATIVTFFQRLIYVRNRLRDAY
jgi:CDP-diacylglycerol--glycerol-3-phosphate 3-phosphatidyltransferase